MLSNRDRLASDSMNAGAEYVPTLVAACGNIQAGDDALGPLVARKLRRLALPDAEVVDLDIRPAGLVDHLMAPRDTLIVVDAVKMDDAPHGLIIDVDWRSSDRPPLIHDDVLSSHGLSIAHQIDLAEKLGMLPPCVRLIGAVIEGARCGEQTSDTVARAVDLVVERIVTHLCECHCTDARACHA